MLEDAGDRLALLFEDGKERSLLATAPGLIEVDAKAVSKESKARAVAPTESKTKLTKVRTSRLLKAVRLLVRDGLQEMKSVGAFPDDTLVDMQKGLSRITADLARFSGTQPVVVRQVSAKSARELIRDHGADELFAELASRIEGAEDYEDRTRSYHDPAEAANDLEELRKLLVHGADIEDRDIERLVALLTPPDLKDARDDARDEDA